MINAKKQMASYSSIETIVAFRNIEGILFIYSSIEHKLHELLKIMLFYNFTRGFTMSVELYTYNSYAQYWKGNKQLYNKGLNYNGTKYTNCNYTYNKRI